MRPGKIKYLRKEKKREKGNFNSFYVRLENHRTFQLTSKSDFLTAQHHRVHNLPQNR